MQFLHDNESTTTIATRRKKWQLSSQQLLMHFSKIINKGYLLLLLLLFAISVILLLSYLICVSSHQEHSLTRKKNYNNNNNNGNSLSLVRHPRVLRWLQQQQEENDDNNYDGKLICQCDFCAIRNENVTIVNDNTGGAINNNCQDYEIIYEYIYFGPETIKNTTSTPIIVKLNARTGCDDVTNLNYCTVTINNSPCSQCSICDDNKLVSADCTNVRNGTIVDCQPLNNRLFVPLQINDASLNDCLTDDFESLMTRTANKYITSYSEWANLTAPYITIPLFEANAQSIIQHQFNNADDVTLDIIQIHFAPIVTIEKKAVWEIYSVESQGWLMESIDFSDENNNIVPTTDSNNNQRLSIPIWHTSPIMKTDDILQINYDLTSTTNDSFNDELIQLVSGTLLQEFILFLNINLGEIYPSLMGITGNIHVIPVYARSNVTATPSPVIGILSAAFIVTTNDMMNNDTTTTTSPILSSTSVPTSSPVNTTTTTNPTGVDNGETLSPSLTEVVKTEEPTNEPSMTIIDTNNETLAPSSTANKNATSASRSIRMTRRIFLITIVFTSLIVVL